MQIDLWSWFSGVYWGLEKGISIAGESAHRLTKLWGWIWWPCPPKICWITQAYCFKSLKRKWNKSQSMVYLGSVQTHFQASKERCRTECKCCLHGGAGGGSSRKQQRYLGRRHVPIAQSKERAGGEARIQSWMQYPGPQGAWNTDAGARNNNRRTESDVLDVNHVFFWNGWIEWRNRYYGRNGLKCEMFFRFSIGLHVSVNCLVR